MAKAFIYIYQSCGKNKITLLRLKHLAEATILAESYCNIRGRHYARL